MRIGIGLDWTGVATQKYRIVTETTDGRYVLKGMPIEVTGLDGSTYLAEPLSGLFLRDKREIKEIEETIDV